MNFKVKNGQFYSYYAAMILQKDIKIKTFLTIYKNKTNFQGMNNGTI